MHDKLVVYVTTFSLMVFGIFSFGFVDVYATTIPNATVTFTPTTDFYLYDNSNTDSCSASPSSVNKIDNSNLAFGIGKTPAEDCYRSVIEWNVTSIHDDAIINDVNFNFELKTVKNNGAQTCDFRFVDSQPSTASNADLWSDVGSGTAFVSNDNICNTQDTDVSIDLGNDAITELKNQLSSDWFGLGIKKYNDVGTSTASSAHYSVIDSLSGIDPTPVPTLEVNYSHISLYCGEGTIFNSTLQQCVSNLTCN